MPMQIRLEVFRKTEEPEVPCALPADALDDIKLNAYERGYVAGWDDSGQQAEREAQERRAAVERQIEALNFTYHEARGHVLRAMEPVFRAMLETVIPEAARAAIIPEVIGQLLPLAHAASDVPITLRISPGCRTAFEAAFGGLLLPPLDIRESAGLQPGQAEIVFDAQETRVDLAQAIEGLRGAIGRFYQIQFEEIRHD